MGACDMPVIHQSRRLRDNFDSSEHGNLCRVIMDSWGHHSSWRSCAQDRPGEYQAHGFVASRFLCFFFAASLSIICCSTFNMSSIRIFQVSSVNVYYLLSNGTIDDLMWYVLNFASFPYLKNGLTLRFRSCILSWSFCCSGSASQGRCSGQTWEPGAGSVSLMPASEFFLSL